MKIGVVIPWREQPSRLPAFLEVCKWYKTNLPEAKMYFVDKGHEIWEMSATRNLGVQIAEADNCDIIIMNDADTIPQIGPLKEAIEAALHSNMIHNPYKIYALFSKTETDLYFKEGLHFGGLKFTPGLSCSGVLVFTPKSWWTLGGQDEKFIKWGYEDAAQQLVHNVIHGQNYVKHSGTVFAFSHELQDNWNRPSEQLKKNEKLFKKYISVSNGPDAKQNILELVKLKEW